MNELSRNDGTGNVTDFITKKNSILITVYNAVVLFFSRALLSKIVISPKHNPPAAD